MSRLRKATKRLLRDDDYDLDDKVFHDEQGKTYYFSRYSTANSRIEQEQIIQDFELENYETEKQYKVSPYTTLANSAKFTECVCLADASTDASLCHSAILPTQLTLIAFCADFDLHVGVHPLELCKKCTYLVLLPKGPISKA